METELIIWVNVWFTGESAGGGEIMKLLGREFTYTFTRQNNIYFYCLLILGKKLLEFSSLYSLIYGSIVWIDLSYSNIF